MALESRKFSLLEHPSEDLIYQLKYKKVNSSIQMLKNASLSILAKPSGNDTAFLWDLISPVYRFLLLNQTQISKLRQWNIKQQVEASQKNIKWSFLTKNVQSLLLKQKNQNTFVNLTFNDWGWVISSDLLANATLISLLTLKGQSILNNLTAEMASLNFNTALNITALKAHLKISKILLRKL